MSMHDNAIGHAIIAALTVSMLACAERPASRSGTREKLPNGAELVRFSELPVASDTAEPDVVIGKIEGEEWETFGQIRSIAADPHGNMYVLDTQASAVRVFGSNGTYLRSLGGPGGGPGEIREANGILLDPQANIWVHDHGAGSLVVLNQEGRELGRHDVLFPGYGIEWLARIDTTGSLRQVLSHSSRPPGAVQAPGVYERRTNRFIKSFSPQNATYDSAHIGEWRSHYVRIDQGGGRYMSGGVLYGPQALVAIGPDGSVWTATSDAYRITRIGPSGDTIVILEASVPVRPLTAEDQQNVRNMFEQAGDGSNTAAMPKHRPVLARLIVDADQRLWVQRSDSSSTTSYDVFEHNGDYVGSLRTRVQYLLYPSPVIANGRIYGVTTDSLDVTYVTRSTLPPRFRPSATVR